jgi:glycosyltransferase involved in cell wall biosynthesis
MEIYHPRYPAIPKVGMNVAPFLLAAAMIRPLRRIIQRGYDFDLVDAYYFYPDGIAAMILGKCFRKPAIITALGSDLNLLPKFHIPRRLIRWAARNAAGVTTVCQSLRDELSKLGVDEENVHVILHGVDLHLFHPPENRDLLRHRFRLSRPTLQSVGNLIESKGHHIVIETLTSLPDMELLIAGRGEQENTLKRLALARGVADRVRFLGFLGPHELRDVYGAADALVLMSSREGIPNVLMESMACGTPVIATNVGGVAEAVTCDEAGILCSERTPAALVAAIRSLLAAYPDRSATRRFAERFCWDDTIRQHVKLMHEVTSNLRVGNNALPV